MYHAQCFTAQEGMALLRDDPHMSDMLFFFENSAPFLKPAQIQWGRETAGREWLPLAQAVQITRSITVKK